MTHVPSMCQFYFNLSSPCHLWHHPYEKIHFVFKIFKFPNFSNFIHFLEFFSTMKFVSNVQHQPFGSTNFKHATINSNCVPFILTFMNKIPLHISPRIGDFVQFPHGLQWSTLNIHNPTQQYQYKDMDFIIYSSITCISPNATTYGQFQPIILCIWIFPQFISSRNFVKHLVENTQFLLISDLVPGPYNTIVVTFTLIPHCNVSIPLV